MIVFSACPVIPNNRTCPIELQNRYAARCSVLIDPNGVFGACIAKLGLFDAELFFESCVYDACHFNESSICLSFEVFALECFLHGVIVPWRNATGCCEYQESDFYRRVLLHELKTA